MTTFMQLELNLTPSQVDCIQCASTIAGLSMPDFVAHMAIQEAGRVTGKHSKFVQSLRQSFRTLEPIDDELQYDNVLPQIAEHFLTKNSSARGSRRRPSNLSNN